MAVLWAGESGTAQEYLSAIRAEIATYSTNTVTRVIAGADHLSILGDQRYAPQVRCHPGRDPGCADARTVGAVSWSAI
ncbi:MAG: hypothetical protein P8Y14_29525 [Anaerolineales bacterium]